MDQDTLTKIAPLDLQGTNGQLDTSRFKRPTCKSRRRGCLIGLGLAVGLLVLAYGGGVYAFSNICYPNTEIAGIDVSLMTRDTAAWRVIAGAENYKLTVSGKGFNWSYEPENITDIFDGELAVDRVIDANRPFTWPYRVAMAYLGEKSARNSHENEGAGGESSAQGGNSAQNKPLSKDDILLPSTFDRTGFTESLTKAVNAYNEGRPGTFDAAGAFDKEAKRFSLEQARANQKLDLEAIEVAALSAISSLSTTVKLDGASYVPLANGATDEELQAAIDAANELVAVNVELKMGGTTVATLDAATLATWLTFDDALKPTLNTEMVTTWVRELAKSKLDTVGTERTFTRADGKQIRVGGGVYGWVSDEAALVAQLQEAIAAKKSGTIDVPVKQTADTYAGPGARDWKAYIDIDLSEQYARYYDENDKVLWESNIVSGNPNLDHATPTGVYQLNPKSRGMTLVGFDENKDGKPDYETPVDYWMPFVGGAIGLHDASWQSAASFLDPYAYTYIGSHGCINLPPAKAAELFEIIPDGICVITHY